MHPMDHHHGNYQPFQLHSLIICIAQHFTQLGINHPQSDWNSENQQLIVLDVEWFLIEIQIS